MGIFNLSTALSCWKVFKCISTKLAEPLVELAIAWHLEELLNWKVLHLNCFAFGLIIIVVKLCVEAFCSQILDITKVKFSPGNFVEPLSRCARYILS